jgi:tetratricopeptide (TPR) repeat protein
MGAVTLQSELCNLKSTEVSNPDGILPRFMSDASGSDSAHARDAASGADRDAKIEHLLLVGLDHYFAAQYEQAINVWTRALFFDRSHARARAYIERARSALAERQRESEELLQTGVAAFHRGEGDTARRLLQAAIDGGAPADEALAVLERLNRLEGAEPPSTPRAGRLPRVKRPRPIDGASHSFGVVAVWMLAAGLAVLAVGYVATPRGRLDLRSLWLPDAPSTTAAPVAVDRVLPLPRQGETILARARALIAGGHLREAIAALEGVRFTDPQRAEADRLRGDIQRQLLALTSVPAGASAGSGVEERRVP